MLNSKTEILLISFIVIFSITLTFVFNYIYKSKIEYKFINSINENNFQTTFNFLCERNLKTYENINPESKREYYQFLDLINENKEYLVTDFNVDKIFLMSPEKLKVWYLYWVNYSYNLVSKEFWVKLSRVYDKKFFVKKVWDRKCVEF